MGNGVEFRIMPSDDEGNWYWEAIKDGHEVVARGVADTEAAACEQGEQSGAKSEANRVTGTLGTLTYCRAVAGPAVADPRPRPRRSMVWRG
jgi:hypothetical protein